MTKEASEKGIWTGRTKAYKGALIFMLFVSAFEVYYSYHCIPVIQKFYPDEDQYVKVLKNFSVTISAAVIAHFVRVCFEYFFSEFFMRNAKMSNDA